MRNTILFDLDGTLLPMQQDAFISAYFQELAIAAAPRGYQKDALIKALWRGTRAMLKGDGQRTNRERFWDDFAASLGEQVRADEPFFDNFYATAFDNARRVVDGRTSARPEIEQLREKGYTLALATNPMFPRVAVERRLRWAGLDASLFDYMTDYTNAHFSKPDPRYYKEVLDAIGKRPEEALMIGNNPSDDMAAREIGIEVYLVPDYLENERGADLSAFPQGSYLEMLEMLRNLPSVR